MLMSEILNVKKNPVEETTALNEKKPTIGARGRAITPMMPSGKVLVDDIEYSASFKSGFADPGDEVVVVGLGAFGLIVDKPDSLAQAPQNDPQ
jgi:membrane-bound ClpP family serine protease